MHFASKIRDKMELEAFLRSFFQGTIDGKAFQGVGVYKILISRLIRGC